MGVRTLHDRNEKMACMYCSVSGWAFGPVFHDTELENGDFREANEVCDDFIAWVFEKGTDPRRLTDSQLEDFLGLFWAEHPRA